MKIQELKNDLIELGLKDNINLVALLYLATTMRKTQRKISILVTGASGAGKSYLVKAIMNLFPQEDIITISRITPAALVRSGDLSNKVLFVYEKFKDELFAQYIRELISEGEVIYSTANMLYHLHGPTTLIETTVHSDVLGIENKSRCFVVGINTSEDARTCILERQKILQTIEGLQAKRASHECWYKHRKLQEELDPAISIVIPFAHKIRLLSLSQHVSRIFDRIANVVSAIAFLQQRGREIKEFDGRRYIEANEEDFYTANDITAKRKKGSAQRDISYTIQQL